jgi:peptide/nickel transport system substrate-binding protein
MSRALWIWDPGIRTLDYDTARAVRLLDSLGWSRGARGVRARGGRELAIAILVPSTSGVRRQLAEGIQEMWRRIGVAASVTAVDFPVFQERLSKSNFDAMIGAWLDEPSPRGLADQWTRRGFEVQNYGRYDNRTFDSLFIAASDARTPSAAGPLWHQAMSVLNEDAAAVFLYTLTNAAVRSRRLTGATIDPFSWMSTVAGWRLSPSESR